MTEVASTALIKSFNVNEFELRGRNHRDDILSIVDSVYELTSALSYVRYHELASLSIAKFVLTELLLQSMRFMWE